MKLSNQVYDVLKWVALIVLPAIATLYGSLATIWGLPLGNEIVKTITAVDLFLGTLIGVSTISYSREEADETEDPEQ